MTTADRAAVLLQISNAIMEHRELPAVFRAVAGVLKDLFPQCDDFGLARYHEPRHMFEVVATMTIDEGASNMGIRTKDTPETPGGYLLKVRRTTLINDMDAFESQSGHQMRRLFPRPFASAVGALLERGDRVLGYLYITSRNKNAFTLEDRDTVDAVRGIIALAFENALAFGELATMKAKAEAEGAYLREEIKTAWPASGLIGCSPAWKTLVGQIDQVAPTESTVLIQGETGTGKEVIARAVHERSRRAGKPLIKVNCGALPDNLVESELFGHEKGSFTGAMGRRIGRFELANGGTIFLDEIGEMPMALQVKLLRVLQEREFERVGGEKPIRVDVRVIAATNKDLSAEVAAGRFRADLFYRLNVFPVQSPPLRTRPEDAVELARYFLARLGERMGRPNLRYSEGSLEAVASYSWPGNVRELEHLVERGIILASNGVVDLHSLLTPGAPRPASTFIEVTNPVEAVSSGKAIRLKETFEEAERAAIEAALADCNGVIGGRKGAAARLGLKRQTLQSKMKKLGIRLGQPTRMLDGAGASAAI
jgi:formate hydrogenlyase transcriptional activator